MQRERVLGGLLVMLGVGIAALMGLALATAPVTLAEDAGAILLPALLAFLLTMPLLLGGAYLLVKTSAPREASREMTAARALTDALQGRGVVLLADVAAQSGLSYDEAAQALDDLIRLRVFNGMWHAGSGQVSMLEVGVLQALERCVVCQRSLRLQGAVTTCAYCGAVYARSQAETPQT